MNTINLELSKKLSPYIKDIITENIYNEDWICEKNLWTKLELKKFKCIPTLTLEEAIEFLPTSFKYNSDTSYLIMWRINTWYYINYEYDGWDDANDSNLLVKKPIYWYKTLLEAIEQMLEYLLINNLLKND